MTVVCLHVKPTALARGIGLMSVTLLGARWSGPRLRLANSNQLELGHSDLVGWSDFYGGGACDVQVALASDGRTTGYLVWGGNLGLRVVPPDVFELKRHMGDQLEHRSLLWLPDVSFLPAHVRDVVTLEPQLSSAPASTDGEAIVAGQR